MKKIKIASCILLLLGTAITSHVNAQSRRGSGPVTPMKVGSVTFNLGVGAGGEYKGDYYKTPFGTKAALEFGLWQAGPGVITLGGQVGASFSGGDKKANTVVVAARSAWHYGWLVPGLDTYGGFSTGLGFHHHHHINSNGKQSEVIPVVGAFVGASYFVTPKFGFNAEAGHDITRMQVGVIFKLK